MDGSRAMRLLSLLIGLGAPVASRTDAAQLTISNAGFESPQLVDGQWTDNDVPGWTLETQECCRLGVWNPDALNLSAGAAYEGENVAYHNSGVLSQTLTSSLTADTRYTLTVQQNLSALTSSASGAWHIELLAGTNVLQSLSGTIANVAANDFVLQRVETTTSSFVAPGQPIIIRFVVDSSQDVTNLVWDDVSLSAEPAFAIDLDRDGDVDGRDLLVLQRGGTAGALTTTDFFDWASRYSAVVPPVASAISAPEPTRIALAIIAVCAGAALLPRLKFHRRERGV